MPKKEGNSKKEETVVKTTEELPVGPPRFSHEPTPPITPVTPESIAIVKKEKKHSLSSPKLSQATPAAESKPVNNPAKPVNSKPSQPKQKPKSSNKPAKSDSPPFSAMFTPIILPSKIDQNEKKELVSKIKHVKKSKDLKVNEEKVSQEKQLKLPVEKKAETADKKPLSKTPQSRKEKWAKRNTILILILLVLALILLVVYLLLNLPDNPSRRDLMVAGDVKEAYVLRDIVYVIFYPYDSEAVQSIKLVFLDSEGTSYPYTIEELSAEYQFYPGELGLENLDSLVAVSGSIEYKPGLQPQNVTPVPPTQEKPNCTDGKKNGDETGIDCGGSCKRCNTGGGWTPTPTPTPAPTYCNNDTGCSSNGISCSGSLPYNCSLEADGCLDRVDLTACAAGWECVNGTGCIETKDCTPASVSTDCAAFFDSCSYGICNSTGKCEIGYNASTELCRAASGECDLADSCSGSSSDCFDSKKADSTDCSLGKCLSGSCVRCIIDGDCSADNCYSGAYRDYFCNLTNGCSYNVITKTENSTNGNCGDGLDNDCDGQTDSSDSGCGASFCGNNIIEGTEVCDGTALGGKTCTDFGYVGGTLVCLTDCSNYNTTGCNDGSIELSSCRTLNQAGKAYKLVNDITIPGSGDCFIISSTDISLDCQNHKITGASAQSAIKITGARTKTVKNCILDNVGTSGNYGAIYVSANNVTIENNEIKNSYKAIKVTGVSYLTISNNVIKNNDYGIESSASSIVLDSVIENNVIESSSYSSGLSLSGNRVLIKNNNISNNEQYGIYSTGTFSNNIIIGNNISRNSMNGVDISSGSNNSFIDNKVLGNQKGISLGGDSNNNLTGNTICSRTTYSDDIDCFVPQKRAAKNTCDRVNFACSFIGGITCDTTCGGASSLSLGARIKQILNSLF